MTKKSNKTKKTPREKYSLGSFVDANRQVSEEYQGRINSIATPQGGQTGSQAVSGLATGASIGTSILPGWGTAIGAVVGGIGGLLFGNSRDRKERKRYSDQVNDLNQARSNLTKDLYESSLDLNNENPYGVYADGGDVFPVNPLINIEKGELQIDPNTGKILREYNGINPETGGMYESHNKKGKDTENNMVTAEEGTFIITKKEAKKYKDAVENNDKLYQNSIMSNIRNQKNKISSRYATGGIVDPNILPQLPLAGINPNMNINIPNTLNRPVNANFTSSIQAPNNNSLSFGDIASTAINYLPSIYNMARGSKRANTMPYTPIRMNVGARQQILSNLPRELSANPALNNIRRARNRAYRSINNNTPNPAIARANRLSLEDSFINAENEALYNNQLINNQIRSQRAGILSNLSAQDQARDAQNVQLLNNTFMTNRQMDLAKQQQFDLGLTQFQQMYQNNRANRQRRGMEQKQLEILRQIFPALSYYPSLTNQTGGI